MDLLRVSPANIDVLAITNDNSDGVTVIDIIAVQHIAPHLMPKEVLAGLAETNQRHALLTGSKGIQRNRRRCEKLLEILQLAFFHVVNGSKTPHLFIEKTELLEQDDRLLFWCVPASADTGKIDCLTHVAADSINLRFQQVNLIVHHFYLFLQSLAFGGQLCHQFFLFLLQGGHSTLDLFLEGTEFITGSVLGLFDVGLESIQLRLTVGQTFTHLRDRKRLRHGCRQRR